MFSNVIVDVAQPMKVVRTSHLHKLVAHNCFIVQLDKKAGNKLNFCVSQFFCVAKHLKPI